MPKKSNKKRADGRYAVQVYIGMTDGKRRYKTVYGATQKEADTKAQEYRAKIHKGIDIRGADDSFENWAALWLSSKSTDIGQTQKDNYRRCIERLNGSFGFRCIEDIKMNDIQEIINSLYAYNENTGKPTSKKLLTLMKSTASQIFQFAQNNRAIEFNPAISVRIPKSAVETKRRALTKTEIGYIENTPHTAQLGAMIMLYAGLRKGELIPLEWSDIDLTEGTISINKAVEYIGDEPKIKNTKTKNGMRTVYMPVKLLNFLSVQEKSSALVFPNKNGEMWKKKQFERLWQSFLIEISLRYDTSSNRTSKYDPRYRGAVGINNITPHMLRHTFCTMMYEAGVDVVTAKEQMGHSDVKTTLSIYTHLSQSHAKDEMRKLNNI